MAPAQRLEKEGTRRADPGETSVLRECRGVPELEELDQRLEAAFLSGLDLNGNEPCVWACACFLVDGSQR